jgi:hypothetical protein
MQKELDASNAMELVEYEFHCIARVQLLLHPFLKLVHMGPSPAFQQICKQDEAVVRRQMVYRSPLSCSTDDLLSRGVFIEQSSLDIVEHSFSMTYF